jgi:mannose-1-phosphate guanylyltransferase
MRSGILLVGGFGTRLHPLTINTPKPFLRVGGVPFIDHQIYKAKAAGITEIVLATSFKASVFEEYCGDGSRYGLKIKYAVEDLPLGTGGAIRNALKLTAPEAEMIAIFNGDVLSEFDLNHQFELTASKAAAASLYLTTVKDARPFGVVTLDEDNFIMQFLEKMENPISNLINAGCYIFSKELKNKIISDYPDNTVISVEREIYPALLAQGEKIYGFVDDTYWLDMGTPQALIKASADLITGKVKSPAKRYENNNYLADQSSKIAETAKVFGGSEVAAQSEIMADSVIEASIIGEAAKIEPNSLIVRSIIAANAVVPAGSILIDNFYGF